MKLTAYKTHAIGPSESILKILDRYVPSLPNNSILAITSKIISLCQNRVVKKSDTVNKPALIREEADWFLEGDYSERYGICLTIKDNILIPTAGIDESNGNDHLILYPTEVQKVANEIWEHLAQREQNKKIGVLITDSRTTPLRRGVTGIALAFCGFAPLNSYIDQPDIHGRPLRVTTVNVPDALAASAVFMMGEGNEQTPLVLIENPDKVKFLEREPSSEEIASMHISKEDDLYAPLLTSVVWQQGGKA